MRLRLLDPRSRKRLPQPRIAIPNPAERELECIDIARQSLRFFHVDDLLHEQLGKMLVEALAAAFLVADAALELVEFAVEDVLAHERRGEHDLDDRHAALALALFCKSLTDDRVE